MRAACVAFVVSVLTFTTLPLAAQQQPDSSLPANPAQSSNSVQSSGVTPGSSESTATLHATARLVVLDVVVTDRHGNSVKGLKQSDFSLSEDGVPQALASFTEHDATVPPEPQDQLSSEELPSSDTFVVHSASAGNGAVTVIVLGGGLDFTDARYVRDQIRDYFRSAAPGMPMAILKLDNYGTHLVQGLTTDRQVLLEAASSKRMLSAPSFSPFHGPYGSFTLSRYLAGIPGRINLIWFSSGGDGQLFPDTTTFVRDLNGLTRILQLSRVALYLIDARGLQVESLGVNGPLGSLSSARAFGHGVPDVALLADSRAIDLATRSGGKILHFNNGFKEDVAEVVNTGAHYYTLSYSPANPDWNGAWRQIHLDVAGYPIHTHPFREILLGDEEYEENVLYRRGYYARNTPGRRGPLSNAGKNAADTAPASPRRLISVSPRGVPPGRRVLSPMQAAMVFGSPAPVQVSFTVTVTPGTEVIKAGNGAALPAENYPAEPFEDAPYRNYLVHYRIDRDDLRFVRTASGSYRDDVQFVVVLYRDDGLEVNSTAYTAHLDIDAATYDRMKNAPLSFDQTLAVPARGDFFIRSGVHELTSDHIGATEVSVEWIGNQRAE